MRSTERIFSTFILLVCPHIDLLQIEPDHFLQSLCFDPLRFEFTALVTRLLSTLMLETVGFSDTPVHMYGTTRRRMSDSIVSASAVHVKVRRLFVRCWFVTGYKSALIASCIKCHKFVK
jgi:hypothetical protein